MRNNLNRTYQKLLMSRWVMFPLLLTFGFAGGLLCAGYFWSRSSYEFLPAEIVIKPSPPNVIACFPDMGFAGALHFQKELAAQMGKARLHEYSDSIIRSSIHACVVKSEGDFALHPVYVSPKKFQVVSSSRHGLSLYGNYTLITESGCYYLHPIPKRRSEDYDSLIQQRWHREAKL